MQGKIEDGSDGLGDGSRDSRKFVRLAAGCECRLLRPSRVVTAVNTALIDLYWTIGQYISRKIADEGWGQGTVAALAEYIIIPHLVVCLREPPSRPRPLRSSAITQNPYSAGSLRTGMEPLLQCQNSRHHRLTDLLSGNGHDLSIRFRRSER